MNGWWMGLMDFSPQLFGSKDSEKFFLRAKNFILDLIFPIECLDCGREGEWICGECFSKVKFLAAQICPVCKKESLWGRVCPECRGKSFLEGILVSTLYSENELIQKLIHLYKYQYIKDLARPLGDRLNKFLAYLEERKKEEGERAIRQGLDSERLRTLGSFPNFFDKQKKPIIMAVPLHGKRLDERAHNQALLLGQIIGERRSWQVEGNIL